METLSRVFQEDKTWKWFPVPFSRDSAPWPRPHRMAILQGLPVGNQTPALWLDNQMPKPLSYPGSLCVFHKSYFKICALFFAYTLFLQKCSVKALQNVHFLWGMFLLSVSHKKCENFDEMVELNNVLSYPEQSAAFCSSHMLWSSSWLRRMHTTCCINRAWGEGAFQMCIFMWI